jgi:membrane-bound lytic murein transglycosylase D
LGSTPIEKSKSTLALKAKTARNSNIASHHGADLHRVKPGENLSLIAKKYKMTILQLKKINGLKGSRIYVGSRLKVHGSKQAHMTRYKVRRGDNLTAIAQRFGMSVMNLKSINSIKNDRIFPGQILTVNM